MKKILSVALLSSLSSICFAQITSSGIINAPAGVRIYNPQMQDINMNNMSNVSVGSTAANGNTVNGPSSAPAVQETQVSALPGMPTSKSSDTDMTEKEFEEMNKKNEKILEDLNKKSVELKNLNQPKDTLQPEQQQNKTTPKVGQVLDINPKHVISYMSQWNTSTIDDFEKTGKENAQTQYELFLQNR